MRNLTVILACCLLSLGCKKSAPNTTTATNSANKSVNLVPKIIPATVIPPTTSGDCFSWGSATRIEGANTSSSTCYFQLNAIYALTMHIDTWEYGVGVRRAHGYVTSFPGASTYNAAENPIAPNSKVQIQYTICSKPYNGTTCTSACCESKTCSFIAYFYRVGYNSDGSPKFYLYKDPQTTGIPDPV